jgi:hypothetical protein
MFRTLAIVLCAGLASCNSTSNAITRAGAAAEAKEALVGKTKGEVFACMGSPVRTASADGVEVLTYESGGELHSSSATTLTASSGMATGFSSGSVALRSCEIDVVFGGGRVTRVNYKGRTGGLLTQGEQCAFAIANCAPHS